MSKPSIVSGTILFFAMLVTIAAPATPALSQDGQPNRIKIEYIPPKHQDFVKIYDQLRQRQVLEKVQEVFSPVKLPGDLSVKSTECGMSNDPIRTSDASLCGTLA